MSQLRRIVYEDMVARVPLNGTAPAMKQRSRTVERRAEQSVVLDEAHRRLVVRLIFVVYLLVIFEGVLRKWVAPHFGKQLFFIRDPFVLAIYALVLWRRTRIRNGFLEVACLIGLAELVVIVGQKVLGGDWDFMSFVFSFYGWRAYFFYIPLAFVIASYMDMKDLGRVARITALICAPIAVLVVVQFFSPQLAPINAGLGDSTEDMYVSANLLPGGFVRTSGTFTSSLGQTTFSVSALAFALSLWLAPGRSRTLKSYVTLASGSAGALICLALSGSRGAVVWSGIVIIVGIAGLLLAPGDMGLKAVVVTLILVVFSAVIPPMLFPQATASFTQRWTDANSLETRAYGSGGIFARALYEIFDFRLLMEDTPLEGYGLGSAGNAAWNLGTRNKTVTFTSLEEIGAAESDWGRHILEMGPFFGSLFILFRVVFVSWLGIMTLRATIRSSQPLPWLLFSFIGVIMFNGQITANGTQNGYAWLFTGFCLAAANTAKAETHLVANRVNSVVPTLARLAYTRS